MQKLKVEMIGDSIPTSNLTVFKNMFKQIILTALTIKTHFSK